MKTHPETISVIGAGIMGISCTYTAQKHFPDTQVTLHDPNGFPAQNASFIAGGMLAPLSELDHMPVEFLEPGFESIRLWSRISAQSNDSFEFSARGSLFIAHQEDQHLLERFKSILPPSGWEQCDRKALISHEPNLPEQSFNRGLFMHGEAHLHPQKAILTLLNAIDNKIEAPMDVDQEAKNADWVIDCRGMGAKDDLEGLRGVKGETLIVHNPDFTLSRPLRLMHPRYPLYIVPREGNIFMIGATILESDEKDNVSIRSAMELMSALYSTHPSFSDADILDMKAGIRPSYADNLPAIQRDGNIIRCNGLYRHGFLCAPVMAECAAHMIMEKSYPFINHFTKGTIQ